MARARPPTRDPSASVLLARLQARVHLRHLQVMAAVAELGTLQRAAEALGLSQPAVTQRLSDLERLVELRLFERHARGARLTAEGEALLPMVRRMLQTLAEGVETVVALRQRGAGTVRVAAVAGALSGLLVRAVPAFAAAHPEVQVQLVETGVDDCLLKLSAGEVDVAACRAPPAPVAGHAFRPLGADRFVVACGPQHPLARRRRVSWGVLARETWLPSPTGSAARRAFDRVMDEMGLQPRLRLVVTRASAMTWALLCHERLLTLVPHGVVRQLAEAGQLAVIEPDPPLPLHPVGLLRPLAGETEAVRRFCDFVEAHARGENAA